MFIGVGKQGHELPCQEALVLLLQSQPSTLKRKIVLTCGKCKKAPKRNPYVVRPIRTRIDDLFVKVIRAKRRQRGSSVSASGGFLIGKDCVAFHQRCGLAELKRG